MLTPTSQIIENENLRCHLIGDDIFYAFYKPETLNEVEHVEIVFDAYKELAKVNPLKVIIEFATLATVSKEARDYIENHKVEAICEAIVITELAQRLIINFYFKIKSHKHPSKAFKNVKNAIAWANSF